MKLKKLEIPQKRINVHLVRPPRLKSEVHKASVKISRKTSKKPK